MQRVWITSARDIVSEPSSYIACKVSIRVIGYSSWSMRFLEIFSIISLLASSGIQVCTNDARFRFGVPSRVSSS